jgi:hypothetical protein
MRALGHEMSNTKQAQKRQEEKKAILTLGMRALEHAKLYRHTHTHTHTQAAHLQESQPAKNRNLSRLI